MAGGFESKRLSGSIGLGHLLPLFLAAALAAWRPETAKVGIAAREAGGPNLAQGAAKQALGCVPSLFTFGPQRGRPNINLDHDASPFDRPLRGLGEILGDADPGLASLRPGLESAAPSGGYERRGGDFRNLSRDPVEWVSKQLGRPDPWVRRRCVRHGPRSAGRFPRQPRCDVV